MEPQIQYAKTSDGVNIAYAVLGTGPAIVFPSTIWGNLHGYKAQGQIAGYLYDDILALGWSVITYDSRGSGSSDRGISDFSLEARIRDLEAVIDRVALERFPICGVLQGGPTAIAYTAQHSERVSHLVLSNTFAKAEEYYKQIPAMRLTQETLQIAEDDWGYHLETLAHALAGYGDIERAETLLEMFRTSMTREDYVAYRRAAGQIDVSNLLPQIRVPTLVVSDSAHGALNFPPLARRLASVIEDARYVEVDGIANTIDDFLREGGLVPAPTVAARPTIDRPAAPSGTAIILFADIADSTALTERMGDEAFREKARELDEALRGAITSNGGTAIEGKLLGDGVLATFGAAREAIACALAIHRMAGPRGKGQGPGPDDTLLLHVGIHAGDVIRESNNVYGGAVNIAARVASEAAAGETLVSATVRDLARTSAGVSFEDRGERELKGVGEAVRVWAVRSLAEPPFPHREGAGG